MNDNQLRRIHIGTSGYSYKDWLGNFYPQFCPQADFLRFYAAVFKTVEIDATFYRIPSKKMIKGWLDRTPDDFIFTAKFPSIVTHEGDIESRLENASKFIDIMTGLDNKLGPLLLQFPYGFKPEDNYDLMVSLLDKIPKDVPLALEVRNKKWLSDDFISLLKSLKISLAQVDHPWMPREIPVTGNFKYIRFLGDRKKIKNDFSYIRDEREEELNWWSNVIEEFSSDGGEVYAYVNNHYSGHSPSSAAKLIEILKSNG